MDTTMLLLRSMTGNPRAVDIEWNACPWMEARSADALQACRAIMDSLLVPPMIAMHTSERSLCNQAYSDGFVLADNCSDR